MPDVLGQVYPVNNMGQYIYLKWNEWDKLRSTWKEEKKELRQYLHATSTRDTSNSKLPWKNSTVTPKLTQIRDNLHANYMAALFPRERWFEFTPEDDDSTKKEKKSAVEDYMLTKMRQHKFKDLMSQIVLDYIDYGNAFVGHEFVNYVNRDAVTDEIIPVYAGPRPYRISPLDIVFDPTATSFADSPCIVRRLKSIGEIIKDVETKPHLEYDAAAVNILKQTRRKGSGVADAYKNAGFVVDGFGNIDNYFSSGMVELHDFYGDIYDETNDVWYTNRIITVADGRYVLRNVENKSWLGLRPIIHCGWRMRSDNLWAAGPLDQLVGMQYRIDHLENLKSDIFDQIAHPVILIHGDTVEDFEFKPEEKIHLGANGKVEFARPEAQALNADMQINELMARMEELAGAPKQAMGIRTPGEKTKYEVQVLENGAGRIFQAKVSWFEQTLIEPLINSMLEEGVRGLNTVEKIRVVDPELGTDSFVEISKKDIIHKGKLIPQGARHFAEQARFVQELQTTLQGAAQIPSVNRHISGWGIAQALNEIMGWKQWNIVKQNVAVTEEQEFQRLANAAQDDTEAEAAMPSELQPEDVIDQEAPPGEDEIEGAAAASFGG